jgi:CRP-like cAMP-binding protein
MTCSFRCAGCLGAVPEWQLLEEPERWEFGRAMRPRVLGAGQTLFLQGQECHGIFCIESGLVGLRRADEDGNSALLRLCQPGDILGYRALLEERDHRNSAEVLAPSRICFIRRSHLNGLVSRNDALRERLLRRALAELNQVEARCAELLTSGLKLRLLSLLMTFWETHGVRDGNAGYQIELPIQRKAIADLLGAQPASLSRLISTLHDEGLVRFKGRRVLISDPSLLAIGPLTSQRVS